MSVEEENEQKKRDEEANKYRCTSSCLHEVNSPYVLVTDAATGGQQSTSGCQCGMVLLCPNCKIVDSNGAPLTPQILPMLNNVDADLKPTIFNSLMEDTPLLEIMSITNGLRWVIQDFPKVKNIVLISDCEYAITFLRGGFPKTDESFGRSSAGAITKAYKIDAYYRSLLDYETVSSSLGKLFLGHCIREFKWMADKIAKDESTDYTSMVEHFQSVVEDAIKAWGAEEHENTERMPLDPEPAPDPVWHLFHLKNHRIRTLLEDCTLYYDSSLQNTIQDRAASDAKGKQKLDRTSHPGDSLKRNYIRQLSAVLICQIPLFWKMALSIIKENFAKYSSQFLDEVLGLMLSSISVYEVKVLNTFRKFEESNVLQRYMSDSIKEIGKAWRVLEAEESAPAIIVTALRRVHTDVSETYILRLCSWMRSTFEERSRDETWVTVSIIERNYSPYRISCLPLTFRSTVRSALGQVHEMLQALKSDAAKAEDVFIPFQEIQETVRLSFLKCFQDFAGHLGRIGSELSQSRSNRGSPHLLNGHSYENSESSSDLSPGSVIDPHQELLMVLSNVGYCKDELCYELYNEYNHIWSHSRERDEEDRDNLVMTFSSLEEKLLQQYTLSKQCSSEIC